ncbi:hypothetical protein [Phenylobacterium sp.]|uniref:hypothetical protein n=1 Tax=Phenylobacterium sp. TaxID=1871053 RepID=UPI002731B706|nr:hypothetical protein [Phenylobacterium sp.]MDP2215522.1 hypothetical protein [Phenylobacterium sp.]
MTRGGRTLAAAGLVVVLHLAAFLALTRMAPESPATGDGPIFEIMLAPPLAALRRRPDGSTEAPIRAAQRPMTPPRDDRGDSAATAPSPFRPAPAADPEATAQAARLRSALRQTFGCSQGDMSRLNEAERAACLERFARGAETAPYRPPLMAGDKQRGLEQAAARKAADRAYRDSVTPPLGIDTTGGGGAMNPLPDL